jgi:hypothetical protein
VHTIICGTAPTRWELVPVALLQLRYAGARHSGFEVLVAPATLQVAIIAGWMEMIARVRVVILCACDGGLRAAMRRLYHVN